MALLSLNSACTREAATPSAKAAEAPRVYSARGVVQGLADLTEKSILIEHEDIPGFMPAMTMQLDFRSLDEVRLLVPGDVVTFDLLVTESDSWISRVTRVGTSPARPLPVEKTATSGAHRLKEGDRLPDFILTDQESRELTRAAFADRQLLMTFIFTRCPLPNFCPLMSRNFAAIQATLRSDPVLRGRVALLSVSFDEEDTPERLRAYAKAVTDDVESWRFATGSSQEIEKLTRAFAVLIKKEGGTLNHGLATVLVSPDGTIRKIWRGNGWTPAEVVAALRTVDSGRVASSGNGPAPAPAPFVSKTP